MSSTAAVHPGVSVLTPTSSDARGSIQLATDASPGARGAMRLAQLFAHEAGWRIRVVSVVDPFFAGVPEFGVIPPPSELERTRGEARARAIRGELAGLGELQRNWHVEVRMGLPAQAIAAAADESRDALVVMGLGRHGLADRLLGRETALHVSRFCSVPVLAVPPSITTLPRIAIVGVDFSDHSVRAAQAALALLPGLSWLYLVHVRPSTLPVVAPDELAELRIFRDSLEPGRGVNIQSVVITGNDPVESLHRFAGLAHADLIVVGTHGHGFFARLVHGSVSTGTLRAADCSVLVVPPPRRAESAAVEAAKPVAHAARWMETVASFSSRNAGRRCTLEADDPPAGARLQAIGFTFLGATCDTNRGVELAFSDSAVPMPDLTRYFTSVDTADVVSGSSESETLRIAHGSARTLLTVH